MNFEDITREDQYEEKLLFDSEYHSMAAAFPTEASTSFKLEEDAAKIVTATSSSVSEIDNLLMVFERVSNLLDRVYNFRIENGEEFYYLDEADGPSRIEIGENQNCENDIYVSTEIDDIDHLAMIYQIFSNDSGDEKKKVTDSLDGIVEKYHSAVENSV